MQREMDYSMIDVPKKKLMKVDKLEACCNLELARNWMQDTTEVVSSLAGSSEDYEGRVY